MFIDQFTSEEIAQIKKELRFMSEQKKQNVFDIGTKLRKIFPEPKEGFHTPITPEESFLLARWRMDNDIRKIVDITLRNIYFKPKKSKRGQDFVRQSTVPNKLTDEYRQMSEEILQIIEKHKK